MRVYADFIGSSILRLPMRRAEPFIAPRSLAALFLSHIFTTAWAANCLWNAPFLPRQPVYDNILILSSSFAGISIS